MYLYKSIFIYTLVIRNHMHLYLIARVGSDLWVWKHMHMDRVAANIVMIKGIVLQEKRKR